MSANRETYLLPIVKELQKVWPDNRTVNIVCHGHSVPAGYTANNAVKPLDAYPHLLRERLSQRFPCSVCNVIVTAVGGEGAVQGCRRFVSEVLNHRPDLVTIDYGLNDRFSSIESVKAAWRGMIE